VATAVVQEIYIESACRKLTAIGGIQDEPAVLDVLTLTHFDADKAQ
jgi:hypothetical protein